METALASELRYSDPIIDERTLLIVVSQSGETADTIAAMRECMARGARSLAIVNVVGSTIARLADNVIYTHAGPEIAVAPRRAIRPSSRRSTSSPSGTRISSAQSTPRAARSS